jgi:hypothetical protein
VPQRCNPVRPSSSSPACVSSMSWGGALSPPGPVGPIRPVQSLFLARPHSVPRRPTHGPLVPPSRFNSPLPRPYRLSVNSRSFPARSPQPLRAVRKSWVSLLWPCPLGLHGQPPCHYAHLASATACSLRCLDSWQTFGSCRPYPSPNPTPFFRASRRPAVRSSRLRVPRSALRTSRPGPMYFVFAPFSLLVVRRSAERCYLAA